MYLSGTWLSPVSDDLIPYHCQRLDLTIQDGCISGEKDVVIPKVLKAKLLEEPHARHIRICQVKALPSNHLWWPHLDQDVEATAAQCEICKKITTVTPTQVPHPHCIMQVHCGREYTLTMEAGTRQISW